jgi:hypothetical protein
MRLKREKRWHVVVGREFLGLYMLIDLY